jgi:hypothetical protein
MKSAQIVLVQLVEIGELVMVGLLDVVGQPGSWTMSECCHWSGTHERTCKSRAGERRADRVAASIHPAARIDEVFA